MELYLLVSYFLFYPFILFTPKQLFHCLLNFCFSSFLFLYAASDDLVLLLEKRASRVCFNKNRKAEVFCLIYLMSF